MITMEDKKRYKVIEKLLQDGEKDTLILGKKAGYKSKDNSSIRRSLKRFLDRNLALKKLHETIEPVRVETVKHEVYDKGSLSMPTTNMGNIKTLEDINNILGDNPILKILSDEILELKKSNLENDKSNLVGEGLFMLDEKYNNMAFDETTVVSLRMSKDAKKVLDNYCNSNKQIKKLHFVSQMIEEYISKLV